MKIEKCRIESLTHTDTSTLPQENSYGPQAAGSVAIQISQEKRIETLWTTKEKVPCDPLVKGKGKAAAGHFATRQLNI